MQAGRLAERRNGLIEAARLGRRAEDDPVDDVGLGRRVQAGDEKRGLVLYERDAGGVSDPEVADDQGRLATGHLEDGREVGRRADGVGYVGVAVLRDRDAARIHEWGSADDCRRLSARDCHGVDAGTREGRRARREVERRAGDDDPARLEARGAGEHGRRSPRGRQDEDGAVALRGVVVGRRIRDEELLPVAADRDAGGGGEHAARIEALGATPARG